MNNINVFALILSGSLLASTLLYLYLVHKTRIRKRFLLTDNLAAALVTTLTVWLLFRTGVSQNFFFLGAAAIALVTMVAFLFTMIRFWRTPVRRVTAGPGQVVSPADGRVIYINRIEKGLIPVSKKGGIASRLDELAKTPLLDNAGWHIGINMTPFDVHKNCSPVKGIVILSHHTDGKFLSLKDTGALTENERNTWVIEKGKEMIGVVQIASRLVRRIDAYVREGEQVEKGQWLGMIRFGSQVDVILPEHYRVLIKEGEQVFAATTIIAETDENTD